MKRYVQTREGAVKVGEIIAKHEIGEYGFCVEILETRTIPQNSSLHLYFTWLAKALNDAGLAMQMQFLGKELEVEWTGKSVKTNIWLPAMEAATGKTKTSKLQRREVSAIYDVLNRFFIEKHDIYVPFPEREKG